MLVDPFARQITYLRLSLTDRCNFRCVYCMPAEGMVFRPRSELLTFEELERLVRVLAARGVRRVRLTGGEPTLRKGLPDLVARLVALDGIEEVVMTTNAFLLSRQARALKEAGLSGLNVSLDSLDPERFAALTRKGSLSRVIEGLEAALAEGFEIKLNVVVIRGFNDDEVPAIVEWAGERGITTRFIEFMPIGGDQTLWGRGGCVPSAELRAVLGSLYRLEPEPREVGANGPARYWRALNSRGPVEGARVGFISAVSDCFCADCNRLRITAEGGLRACLADDREVNLRALLRGGESDQALLDAVGRALGEKRVSHRFDDADDGRTRRVMSSIGG